jgi:hypothetical protein
MSNHMNMNAPKKLTWVGRIFIWLAGSSENLLRRCPDSERVKHEAIGAAVMVPVAFGFAAAYYTSSSLSAGPVISTAIGFFWAGVITIIDRTFLATYRKTKRQWTQAVVRLGIAALTSIVIAHPLVLWTFRDSIAHQIDAWRRTETARIENSAVSEISALRKEKTQHLAALEQNLTELHSRQKKADEELSTLRRDLTEFIRVRNAEVNGERGTKLTGPGRIASDLEKNAIKPTERVIAKKEKASALLAKEIEDTTSAIDRANRELSGDQEIANARKARDEELHRVTEQKRGDVLGQMKALGEIEVAYPFVSHARRTLFALFFLVDAVALLSKLLCPRGKYDDLLEQELFESGEDLKACKAVYPAMALEKANAATSREMAELAVDDALNHALAPLRGATQLAGEVGEHTRSMLLQIEEMGRYRLAAESPSHDRIAEELIEALLDAMRRANLAAIARYNNSVNTEMAKNETNYERNGENSDRRFQPV